MDDPTWTTAVIAAYREMAGREPGLLEYTAAEQFGVDGVERSLHGAEEYATRVYNHVATMRMLAPGTSPPEEPNRGPKSRNEIMRDRGLEW
jgi:hypothetical protein